MALRQDFSVVVGGGTWVHWTDPEGSGAEPSRVRPHPGRPHLSYQLELGIDALTAECVVGGVVAPPDASLGGRLFVASWVAYPLAAAAPAIVQGAGDSATIEVTPKAVGHHELLIYRPGGGGLIVPFDVVQP